jgi:hypothetical protein
MRLDAAGYQTELLKYCAEGTHERFGVIEFAVGVDVTPKFKEAVAQVAEEDGEMREGWSSSPPTPSSRRGCVSAAPWP